MAGGAGPSLSNFAGQAALGICRWGPFPALSFASCSLSQPSNHTSPSFIPSTTTFRLGIVCIVTTSTRLLIAHCIDCLGQYPTILNCSFWLARNSKAQRSSKYARPSRKTGHGPPNNATRLLVCLLGQHPPNNLANPQPPFLVAQLFCPAEDSTPALVLSYHSTF